MSQKQNNEEPTLATSWVWKLEHQVCRIWWRCHRSTAVKWTLQSPVCRASGGKINVRKKGSVCVGPEQQVADLWGDSFHNLSYVHNMRSLSPASLTCRNRVQKNVSKRSGFVSLWLWQQSLPSLWGDGDVASQMISCWKSESLWGDALLKTPDLGLDILVGVLKSTAEETQTTNQQQGISHNLDRTSTHKHRLRTENQ